MRRNRHQWILSTRNPRGVAVSASKVTPFFRVDRTVAARRPITLGPIRLPLQVIQESWTCSKVASHAASLFSRTLLPSPASKERGPLTSVPGNIMLYDFRSSVGPRYLRRKSFNFIAKTSLPHVEPCTRVARVLLIISCSF